MKPEEIQVGRAYIGRGHTTRSVRIVAAIEGQFVTYVAYFKNHGQRRDLIKGFAKWAKSEYLEGVTPAAKPYTKKEAGKE